PNFPLRHPGNWAGPAMAPGLKVPGPFQLPPGPFRIDPPGPIRKAPGIRLGLETRIWSHTFVFLFAILAASFAPNLWTLRFIGFGVATHLLVDRIWEMPWVVLYPAYGWSFHPASQDAEHWIATLLHDPLVQAGEIVG